MKPLDGLMKGSSGIYEQNIFRTPGVLGGSLVGPQIGSLDCYAHTMYGGNFQHLPMSGTQHTSFTHLDKVVLEIQDGKLRLRVG